MNIKISQISGFSLNGFYTSWIQINGNLNTNRQNKKNPFTFNQNCRIRIETPTNECFLKNGTLRVLI